MERGGIHRQADGRARAFFIGRVKMPLVTWPGPVWLSRICAYRSITTYHAPPQTRSPRAVTTSRPQRNERSETDTYLSANAAGADRRARAAETARGATTHRARAPRELDGEAVRVHRERAQALL